METFCGGEKGGAKGSKRHALALPDGAVVLYRREGGFAVTVEQWTVFPDGRIVGIDGSEGQVTPQAVTELLAAIEAAGFFKMKASYMPLDTCCDRFTYWLTVRHGDGVQSVVTLDATPDVPPSLWDALDAVQKTVDAAREK